MVLRPGELGLCAVVSESDDDARAPLPPVRPTPFRRDAPMIAALALRVAAFALVWWVLTEGRADSWGVGAASIGLALAASLKLAPPARLAFSPLGIARFAGFFLVESMRGGTQVALAALRPAMPLAPDLVPVRVRLPAGLPRVLLMNTLNLLPGTLSVTLDGDTLWLHVLDRTLPIAREVATVEAHIARALKLEGIT